MRLHWVVAAGWLCACSSKGPVGLDDGDAGGPICLTLADVDFGEVDGRATHRVSFSNPDPQFLHSLTVGTLQPPFSASPAGRMSIPPGGERTIELSFEPTDGLAHLSSFFFTGGEGCAPQAVALRGLGAGSLFVPQRLDFGAVPLGELTTRTLQLSNSRRVLTELRLSLVDASGSFVLPRSLVMLAPSSGENVEIGVAPRTAGPRQALLQLTDGVATRTVVLTASGGFPSGVAPATVEVDVPVWTGEAPWAAGAVVLRNEGTGILQLAGGEPLQIDAGPGALAEELDMDLQPLRNGLVPDASVTVRFVARPRGQPFVGSRTWTVTLQVNQPSALRLDVRARLFETDSSCEGLLLSPSVLHLPRADAGTVVTTELAFFNDGGSRCDVADLHVETDDSWKILGPLQLSIDAGAAVPVSLEVTASNAPQYGLLRYRPLSPRRAPGAASLAISP